MDQTVPAISCCPRGMLLLSVHAVYDITQLNGGRFDPQQRAAHSGAELRGNQSAALSKSTDLNIGHTSVFDMRTYSCTLSKHQTSTLSPVCKQHQRETTRFCRTSTCEQNNTVHSRTDAPETVGHLRGQRSEHHRDRTSDGLTPHNPAAPVSGFLSSEGLYLHQLTIRGQSCSTSCLSEVKHASS